MEPPILEDPSASPRLYPAITACIHGERKPTRDEIRIVAARLWREGLAFRFGPEADPPGFAACRVLLRAAIAALSGREAIQHEQPRFPVRSSRETSTTVLPSSDMDALRYAEQRAAQERLAAETAACDEARCAHDALARAHEQRAAALNPSK